jgi:hypothetical protein
MTLSSIAALSASAFLFVAGFTTILKHTTTTRIIYDYFQSRAREPAIRFDLPAAETIAWVISAVGLILSVAFFLAGLGIAFASWTN